MFFAGEAWGHPIVQKVSRGRFDVLANRLLYPKRKNIPIHLYNRPSTGPILVAGGFIMEIRRESRRNYEYHEWARICFAPPWPKLISDSRKSKRVTGG